MATSKVVLVKEAGTHPLGEGFLSRFARVHTLRSIRDLEGLERSLSDVVLVDVSMPTLDGLDVLRRLQASPKKPLLILINANLPPDRLAGKLAELSALRAPRSRRFSVAHAQDLLGVSQELFARILGVSVRTVHRWLKGERPRPRPALEQLQRLVASLEQTLDTPEAIHTYLHSPNPGLDGERPISYLLRSDFSRIEDHLLAIREGVYV